MIHLLMSGSSGFVGSNFLKYISSYESYKITKLTRSYSNSDNTSISWELIENLPNDIETILHFAGIANVSKSIKSDSYFDINTRLTVLLFKKYLESSARKFIFLSSVKASTDYVNGILNEEMICNPGTVYGQSKYQAECEVQILLERYNKTHPDKKKELFILRPCMIHGPGNKGNLNLLYQFVLKGLPWPLGAFDNNRSFCSIENLLFILKELIDRQDIPSGIYNVADDDPISTNELIDLIAISHNKKSIILKLPKQIFICLAKLGDNLNLPINSERLEKLTSSYLVSNLKIKKAIGKPLPILSRDGILHSFQSFSN